MQPSATAPGTGPDSRCKMPSCVERGKGTFRSTARLDTVNNWRTSSAHSSSVVHTSRSQGSSAAATVPSSRSTAAHTSAQITSANDIDALLAAAQTTFIYPTYDVVTKPKTELTVVSSAPSDLTTTPSSHIGNRTTDQCLPKSCAPLHSSGVIQQFIASAHEYASAPSTLPLQALLPTSGLRLALGGRPGIKICFLFSFGRCRGRSGDNPSTCMQLHVRPDVLDALRGRYPNPMRRFFCRTVRADVPDALSVALKQWMAYANKTHTDPAADIPRGNDSSGRVSVGGVALSLPRITTVASGGAGGHLLRFLEYDIDNVEPTVGLEAYDQEYRKWLSNGVQRSKDHNPTRTSGSVESTVTSRNDTFGLHAQQCTAFALGGCPNGAQCTSIHALPHSSTARSRDTFVGLARGYRAMLTELDSLPVDRPTTPPPTTTETILRRQPTSTSDIPSDLMRSASTANSLCSSSSSSAVTCGPSFGKLQLASPPLPPIPPPSPASPDPTAAEAPLSPITAVQSAPPLTVHHAESPGGGRWTVTGDVNAKCVGNTASNPTLPVAPQGSADSKTVDTAAPYITQKVQMPSLSHGQLLLPNVNWGMYPGSQLSPVHQAAAVETGYFVYCCPCGRQIASPPPYAARQAMPAQQQQGPTLVPVPRYVVPPVAPSTHCIQPVQQSQLPVSQALLPQPPTFMGGEKLPAHGIPDPNDNGLGASSAGPTADPAPSCSTANYRRVFG